MKQILFFIGVLIFAACQTHPSSNDNSVSTDAKDFSAEASALLKDGDLVMRSDEDIIGLTLRNMNDSDKTFSHSGLAFKEDTSWYIYNMMAGEENPSMEMRREPLEDFIDPKKKSGYGIYRYDLSNNEIDSLHKIIQQQFQQKLKFDSSFNLNDDSEMYCSEMIARDLLAATHSRIKIPTTYKDKMTFKAIKRGRQTKRNIEYIALDNLFLNKWCTMVIKQRYK